MFLIVCPLIYFTASGYPFRIFKLFYYLLWNLYILFLNANFYGSSFIYFIIIVRNRQIGGFLRILKFPPPIKLTATM
jgi:hypothetical protein